MTNLTLKQLRYFEALARHSHFGRAADACAISQPAISVQIKELEEELGTELFERSARQVRLTGFGEEFAERVRDILRSVDELGDLARASRDRLAGRLRIGVIPTIAPYLLPAIIGNLSRTHDGLDIHVRETLTGKLINELAQGRLDTAIVALPVSEPSLTEVALFTENFVLVRPGEDEGKPVPNREMLREMRLLLLEEGHCFRDQALMFCGLQQIENSATFGVSSLSTLLEMVANGLGVTLIPEISVGLESRRANIHLMRFADPEPKRVIGLAWRRSSPRKHDFVKLGETITAVTEQLRTQASEHHE